MKHRIWLHVMWLSALLAVLGISSPMLAEETSPGDSTSTVSGTPNSLEIDWSTSYVHFSKNKLIVNGYSIYDAIIIGELQVDEIKRDIITSTVTLSGTIGAGVSLEAAVPLRYQRDDMLERGSSDEKGDPTEEVWRGYGLGDIDLAVSYQRRKTTENTVPLVTTVGLRIPTGVSPYAVSQGEVPTGSGHWGARIGFTKVKALDPAAIFGSVSYVWNAQRSVDGRGKIDPGDTIQYSVGMAYALNQVLSANLRFEQGFTGKTTVDGASRVGSDANTASLNIGVTYITDSNRAVDFAVGVGLTEDSPDFMVRVGFPFGH